MAGIKLNARDMIVEIRTDDSPETWTEIGGLTNFVYNPSENEETADTTTFADEGNYRQEIMQRGATAEIEGFRIADSITGVPDAGQAAAEAQHELLGPESVGKLRFRHVLDQEWKVWDQTVTVGEIGGETNDKASWSATFTRCGPSVSVDVA